MKLLTFVLFGAILMGCKHEARYDCSMAEWHPDIPTKVKEECRKLRK